MATTSLAVPQPEPPQDVRQFLEAFLAAFWSEEGADLSTYATPEALAAFNESRGSWISYRLNWSPAGGAPCELGPTGSGACTFVLISPQGGGFTWEVSYHETDASGGLVIDDFTSIGGGM